MRTWTTQKTLGEDSMELNAVDAEVSSEESAFVVKQNLTVRRQLWMHTSCP
jgi:hypothetical protein